MWMYGWHGKELFTVENILIMYISTVLKTVLGDSFKHLLIWEKNLG